MARSIRIAAAVALALVAAPTATAAACRPTATGFSPRPGDDFSEVLAFGPGGLVGGDSANPVDQHAVLWHDGRTFDTGIPHSFVADIDRHSDVLINASDFVGSDSHAYLDVAGAGRRELLGLGGDFVYVRRMDDRRDVVGGATGPGGREHALVWPGGSVVPRKLATPAGFDDAEAAGINSRGDIAGNAYDRATNTLVPVVWRAGGPPQTLPAEPFQGHAGYGQAYVIDELGIVAGESGPADVPGRVATLWIGPAQHRVGQFLDGGSSTFFGTAAAGIEVGGGTYAGTFEDGAIPHAAVSVAGVGPLRTLNPLSGDPRDESLLHVARFERGDVTVGGYSATGAAGALRGTVWTCALRQSFVPSRSLLDAPSPAGAALRPIERGDAERLGIEARIR
jgi:hypothetical protein